jgi:hypothetical protein
MIYGSGGLLYQNTVVCQIFHGIIPSFPDLRFKGVHTQKVEDRGWLPSREILPENGETRCKPLIIKGLHFVGFQMGNKNGHFCKFLSRSGSGFSRQKFFLTIPGNNPIYFNRLKECGQYFPGRRAKIEKRKINCLDIQLNGIDIKPGYNCRDYSDRPGKSHSMFFFR